jgi:uncharacterized iron-regulated membrane protein
MKKSLTLRGLLGRLHLWLGLASGLLVFLISVSGALYAFRDELFRLVHREALRLSAPPPASPPLPLSRLLQSADSALAVAPGARGGTAKTGWITTAADPTRSWEFRAYEGSDSALTYFGEVRHDLIVFVNPYTGAVIDVLDHKHEFFQLVKMFHWSFLLATDIGQPIVGYSVAVFVFMMISGLILWWPKKLRLMAAKLRIPWSAGWKSKFYALHTALGACVTPVALVIALTGLYYAFRVVASMLYVIVALSTAPPDFDMGSSLSRPSEPQFTALDAVYDSAWRRHPQARTIGFGVPQAGRDSAVITASVRENDMVYYKGARESYDRRTGALIKAKTFAALPRGEKYLAMNYDIHVGAALGLPGKILAFIASLVCASLPVTGFLIWRGRRKRKTAPAIVSQSKESHS